MAQQMIFFNKSVCDFSDSNVTATASQGSDYASNALNRSNNSAWITTDSVDSDNTTFTVDMVDSHAITDILLIKHNFSDYTIKYWDGAAYQDFSTAINVSGGTAVNTHHTFNSVTTSKLQITITGTIVADSDKQLYQFIATTKIGQLDAFPVVKPVLSRNIRKQKMLSGKLLVTESIGAFKADFKVRILSLDADLSIIEELFSSNEGFLVWPCGGDEDQFATERLGWRLEDIYLCKCINEWKPEWYKGLYQTGMKIDIKVHEIV